jgi:hypothetical protein
MLCHRNICRQVMFVICLISFTQCTFAFSDSPKSALLSDYVQAAFAQTDRLIKFSDKPEISFLCADDNCAQVIKAMRLLIKNEIIFETSASPSKSAKIVVQFYKDVSSRKQNPAISDLHSSEEIQVKSDPRCSMIRLSARYTVKKIAIDLAESEGVKKNVFCLIRELLIGSGVSLSQTYEEETTQLDTLLPESFLLGLNAYSILLEMHWDLNTSPGDNQKKVVDYFERTFGKN